MFIIESRQPFKVLLCSDNVKTATSSFTCCATFVASENIYRVCILRMDQKTDKS